MCLVFRFFTAAYATFFHVQRQRGRKRIATPPVVAHPAVVPVDDVVVVLVVLVVGRHHHQQSAAHTDAIDQLPAQRLDRRPDAHRGRETHPVGRGLPDTHQVAADQGRGEVAEENPKEN